MKHALAGSLHGWVGSGTSAARRIIRWISGAALLLALGTPISGCGSRAEASARTSEGSAKGSPGHGEAAPGAGSLVLRERLMDGLLAPYAR